MDCRVKPGNDDGWVRAALKSRTPLRFRGNDDKGAVSPLKSKTPQDLLCILILNRP